MAEDKYQFQGMDLIPGYGIINYLNRTSADVCDESSMEELRGNLLRRGVYTFLLIGTNALVIAKGLEAFVN